MKEVTEIEIFILNSLIQKKKIGGAHTPLENITRNLPDYLVLDDKRGKKLIDYAVKQLINLTWVTATNKKTGKGSDSHISINPRALRDIYEFFEKMKKKQSDYFSK